MRFYNQPHAFYAGIDLHARTMFTHVLDSAGKTVFERDLPSATLQGSSSPICLACWWHGEVSGTPTLHFPLRVWQRKPSLHGNVQRPDPV